MTTETGLRRDAAANRERILTAASRLFGEQGLDASMDEIGRAAGVGAGTLYRRFPTKEALLEAILADGLDRIEEFARAALDEEDAFAGLAHFLERSLLLQVENRAFVEVLTLRLTVERRLTEARERIRPLTEQLVARAQEQGTLRADLTAADVQVLFWELGRVIDATGTCAAGLWRRYLALALDGLRATAASPLPHPPPTLAQLDQAMVETAERRGLNRKRR